MALWYRRNLAFYQTLQSDAGTFLLDLPKQGLVNQLELKLQWTNGSTDGHGVNIFDAFDLIEILGNGSQVIFSMTPRELAQFNTLYYSSYPAGYFTEEASGVQYIYLKIPFAFSLSEAQRGLQLSKFNNVQLRISYSPTIAASAGFATGAGVVDISAIMLDNEALAGGGGFIRARTIRSFASAASGEEKIEINSNFPVLGVGMAIHAAASYPEAHITRAKLEINDGSRVVFDRYVADLRKQVVKDYGVEAKFVMQAFAQNGDTIQHELDCPTFPVITHRMSAPTIGTTPIPHYFVNAITGNTSTITAYRDTPDGAATAQAAYSTDQKLSVEVYADRLPYGFIYPFGLFSNGLDALNPADSGTVHLTLTNSGTGATVRVGLYELAAPEL